MFDIGFWELALIGIIALLVLGPQRLPEAARAAGQWVARIRNFINNVKQDLDQQLRADELAELRKLKEELEQARQSIAEAGQGVSESINRISNDDYLLSAIDDHQAEPQPTDTGALPADTEKKKVTKKKTASKKSAGRSKAAVRKNTAEGAGQDDK